SSAAGIELQVSVESRMAGGAAVGDHKTSMLQDIGAQKPLELDPLLGAVVALADGIGVSVPAIRALYGLANLRDASSHRKDYPGSQRSPRRSPSIAQRSVSITSAR